ncbi:MAG: hypothetical protein WBL50_18370 [Candidatus Acidiferrum sp.]
MQPPESTKDLKGKIVRWTTSNWGIINFYNVGDQDPRKTFVHASKIISGKPTLGSFVVFDLGPARSANELPAALNVRVITSAEAL